MDLASKMWKGNRLYPTLFLFILVFTSCTVISKDIDRNVTVKNTSFELSKTHFSEVIEQVGPPSKLSKYNNGLVFLYESINIKENQIGLSADYNILKWLKFSYAKGVAERQVLLLIFDNKGFLISQNYKEFEENLGSGQAIDYLFSIESLVDASKLEEDPSSLTWGSSLLKPLPEALNSPHNLGTGESGVEQLGAPNTVGQHSLELEQ
ncbi:MAG: hypothetical protein DHS20C13_11660 [Thermodesulfobacteriota bacterium]|nr:MAG: hypothetical protein DHS20C13_11660 [Thermodesulfobacteriota bacterium]